MHYSVQSTVDNWYDVYFGVPIPGVRMSNSVIKNSNSDEPLSSFFLSLSPTLVAIFLPRSVHGNPVHGRIIRSRATPVGYVVALVISEFEWVTWKRPGYRGVASTNRTIRASCRTRVPIKPASIASFFQPGNIVTRWRKQELSVPQYTFLRHALCSL